MTDRYKPVGAAGAAVIIGYRLLCRCRANAYFSQPRRRKYSNGATALTSIRPRAQG